MGQIPSSLTAHRERLFMPHDDDVLRRCIRGILEGNRAHHVEIEAVSFKKIEPLQINMDDYSSFQDQQLLRVSPSAPWAVRNACATGKINDDDLHSTRHVLRGSVSSTIAGVRITPDRLVGEAGEGVGGTVAVGRQRT